MALLRPPDSYRPPDPVWNLLAHRCPLTQLSPDPDPFKPTRPKVLLPRPDPLICRRPDLPRTHNLSGTLGPSTVLVSPGLPGGPFIGLSLLTRLHNLSWASYLI